MSNHSYVRLNMWDKALLKPWVFLLKIVYGRQSLGETTHSFENNCPTKGALSSNSSRIVNVQAM